ncbi:MAG: hypothetical protein U0003_02430 [Vampirovibrionales bacterium]
MLPRSVAYRKASTHGSFHDDSWGISACDTLDIALPTMETAYPTGITNPMQGGPAPTQETTAELPLKPPPWIAALSQPLIENWQRNHGPAMRMAPLWFLGFVFSAGMLSSLLSMPPFKTASVFEPIHQPALTLAAVSANTTSANTATLAAPLVLPNTAQLLQQAQMSFRVPYGREDPFSPLLTPEKPETTNPDGTAPAETGPILTMTGLIEGMNGKLVAILKSNGATPTSYIKEPGDRFMVDGHRVMLKRVSKRNVTVVIDGLTQTLPLEEYSTSTPSNSGSANNATNRPAQNSPSLANAINRGGR